MKEQDIIKRYTAILMSDGTEEEIDIKLQVFMDSLPPEFDRSILGSDLFLTKPKSDDQP